MGLSGAMRKKKAFEAYEMHIRRVTYRDIAKELSVGKDLVSTLIREEADRQSGERRSTERMKAIATYEKVIKGAMDRVVNIPDRSNNLTGLFNVIVNAQKSIDDITGVRSDEHLASTEQAINNFAMGMQTAQEVYAEMQKNGIGQSEQ